MTAGDYAGIIGIIGATTGGIASVVVAIRQNGTVRTIKQVHENTTTTNGHSLAELVETSAARDQARDAAGK